MFLNYLISLVKLLQLAQWRVLLVQPISSKYSCFRKDTSYLLMSPFMVHLMCSRSSCHEVFCVKACRFSAQMFPINFAKFLEHLFCRTSANSCFSCSIHSKLNQLTKFLISGKCLGTDFTETKIFIDCRMQLTIYEEEPQVNIHRSSKNSCFEKFCNIFNKETRSAKPFSKLLKP